MNAQPVGGLHDGGVVPGGGPPGGPVTGGPVPGGPVEELRREEAGLLACVHCGFCLNACPTYTRLGHEGDSPRGRLDLMRAVMEGRLEPDDEAFRTHIDQCLGCRACEPVCPSGVPYGFLLERARAAIAQSAGVSPSTRLLIAAYSGPLRSLATLGSRFLRATGLARILARAAPQRLFSIRFGMAMLASSAAAPRLLARGRGRRGPSRTSTYGTRSAATVRSGPAADAVRDSTSAPSGQSAPGAPHRPPDAAADIGADGERGFADPHGLMGAYPHATGATAADATRVSSGPATGAVPFDAAGTTPRRPRVALLTGCVQESLFARVNRATGRVLAANSCEVVTVPAQECCGALDAHAGRLDRARELARRNIAAFERAGVDTVVVNAAGCGAMMKEYGEQLRHDPEWAERAEAFVRKVRDVSEFLMEQPLRRGAHVPLRVTYDAPCHLHHGQRIRDAPLQVLDSVPGLERVPLADADECCGGAGLYGVNHPELGGRILSDKVAAIRATGADAVLTPNPGCMMQIGAGLLLAGADTVVLHPIEILDESYRRAAAEAGT